MVLLVVGLMAIGSGVSLTVATGSAAYGTALTLTLLTLNEIVRGGK
jgi:hypothetical protein